MRSELINTPSFSSATHQILFNRGIPADKILDYINLSDDFINSYTLLGEEKLHDAASKIALAVNQNNSCIVVVDCDCDGYTSAAVLLNYLYTRFPAWVLNSVDWYMHNGKEHGLHDCIDYIMDHDYQLVICPDSASNDYEEHRRLKEDGRSCIILDHHLADKDSEDAIVINSQ